MEFADVDASSSRSGGGEIWNPRAETIWRLHSEVSAYQWE